MALILVCSESQNKLVKDKHLGCIQSCQKAQTFQAPYLLSVFSNALLRGGVFFNLLFSYME